MLISDCFLSSVSKKMISIFIVSFFFISISYAQQTDKNTTTESKVVTVSSIKDYLKKLSLDPNFQFAQIGFSLKSLASGKIT